jgi:hypothetical protein
MARPLSGDGSFGRSGRRRPIRDAHDPESDSGQLGVVRPDLGVVIEGDGFILGDGPGQVDRQERTGRDDVLLTLPETEATTPSGETSSELQGRRPGISDGPGVVSVTASGGRPAQEGRAFDDHEHRSSPTRGRPCHGKGHDHQSDQDRGRSRPGRPEGAAHVWQAAANPRLRQAMLCEAVSSAPGE